MPEIDLIEVMLEELHIEYTFENYRLEFARETPQVLTTLSAPVPQAQPSAISWSGVTDKPTQFPPAIHTHTAADISDFSTAVNGAVNITVIDGGNF